MYFCSAIIVSYMKYNLGYVPYTKVSYMYKFHVISSHDKVCSISPCKAHQVLATPTFVPFDITGVLYESGELQFSCWSYGVFNARPSQVVLHDEGKQKNMQTSRNKHLTSH